MSLNFSWGPRAFSFSNNFSTAALFKTLSVLRNGRIIKRVSSSLAATKACLTFSCTGASLSGDETGAHIHTLGSHSQ